RATAGGAPLSPGARLPVDSHEVSFRFAAPVLGHSADLRYRYRLRGSGEWSEPLSYQPITFAALPAGSYLFEVQARLGRGDWGPVTHFDFGIEPALWERGPVRFGALGLALLLLLLGFKLRLRAAEQSRQRLSQE